MNFWIIKGGFSLVNRVIIFLFGFSSYFILVRILSQSDFGIYAIYTVIVTLSETSRLSFIQNGHIKFVLDDKYNKDKVKFASLILNISLSLFLSLLVFGSSFIIGDVYNSDELKYMLQVYCISLVISIPLYQVSIQLGAEIDFKNISKLSFIRYFSFFTSILLFYIFFHRVSLVHLAILQGSSILLATIFSLFFFKRYNFSVSYFDISLLKKLFHFGKYVFGTGLTSMITSSVDQLMLGYFVSPIAVALYNTSSRFLNFIDIPVTSISQVIYPKFSSTINSPNPKSERRRLFEKSNGIMFSIITPLIIAILLFPSFFIQIVAGKQYIEAAPILRLLILFSILKPLAVQAGSVLEASSKPNIIFFTLALSTVINVVGNYFLIQLPPPIGGAFGAVLASAISSMTFVTIALIFTYKFTAFSFTGILIEMFKTYKHSIYTASRIVLARKSSN